MRLANAYKEADRTTAADALSQLEESGLLAASKIDVARFQLWATSEDRVATGYRPLDDVIGGLRRGGLYVIGSRPTMGKTSFALGMAAHAAPEAHHPVLIFSLEMSQQELSQRILCAEARVDLSKVKGGQLDEEDWNRISDAVGRLAAAPIYIDDHPHTTIMDIQAKTRRLQGRVGELAMVVIDYIQLMTGRVSAESRQVEVADMSRNLKILARELHVPVVALAQLNRQLEHRLDRRPILSDLRESGSLAEDGDVVLFLYRDEVYDSESLERGTAEVIVGKNRNGDTTCVRLAFRGEYTRFDNMAPPSEHRT